MDEYTQERIDNGFLYHDTTKDGILYKYCSFQTLVQILTSHGIYYSTAHEFNDPFELATEIFKEYEDVDFLKNVFKISDEHTLKRLATTERRFYKQMNVWEELKDEIGICCFSKSPLVTLMWSHYSDKYKGACIGFNFDQIATNEKIIQMPVRYIDRIETRTDIWNESKAELSIYHWLLTKSKVWEYEQEVRRIYINAKGVIPFKKEVLQEIYLGIRLSQNDRRLLKELLSSNQFQSVEIFETEINPETYTVTLKTKH